MKGDGLRERLERFEKRILDRVLKACGGDVGLGARALKLARSTFTAKLERHGLWSPAGDVGRSSPWLKVDISTSQLSQNQFRYAVSTITVSGPTLRIFGLELRPDMDSFRAEGQPGRCLACDKPLPRVGGRQPVVCTDGKGGKGNTPCENEYAAAQSRDAGYRSWAVRQVLVNATAAFFLLGVAPRPRIGKRGRESSPRVSKALRLKRPAAEHPWRRPWPTRRAA